MISSSLLLPAILMSLGIFLIYLNVTKKEKVEPETLEQREARVAKAVEDGSTGALILFCKKPTDKDLELKMYAEFELLFRRDVMLKYKRLRSSTQLKEINEYFQDG